MEQLKFIKINSGVNSTEIEFKKDNLSVIYGDYYEEKDKTSNSSGKTALQDIIDYIYGGNSNETIKKLKVVNENMDFQATFQSDRQITRYVRTAKIQVYGYSHLIDVDSYKKQFGIDRSLTQGIFNKSRKGTISFNYDNPTGGDYKIYLELLNLKELYKYSKKISDLVEKIKKNEDKIAELSSKLDDESSNKIEEIDLELKKIKEHNIVNKLEINTNIEVKLQKLKAENKSIELEISKIKMKMKDMSEYLHEKLEMFSGENKEFFDEIKEIFKPEKLRSYNEVIKFQEEYFYEKNKNIKNDLKNLKVTLQRLEEISIQQRDKISKLVQIDSVGNETIKLLEYFEKLIKEREQILNANTNTKEYINTIEEIEQDKLKLSKMQEQDVEYHMFEKKCKIYIDEMLRKIYGVEKKFDFKLRKKEINYKKAKYPIDFEFEIEHEGEALKVVKKLLIDLLIFNFNENINIMMWDSSCFNGVDPKQLYGIISEIRKIAMNKSKQAIININAYQLEENGRKMIRNNIIKKCSIDNNIFGFYF